MPSQESDATNTGQEQGRPSNNNNHRPNEAGSSVNNSIEAPLIGPPASFTCNTSNMERKEVATIAATIATLAFAGAGMGKLMTAHDPWEAAGWFVGAALFAVIPLHYGATRLGLFQCCSTDSNNSSPFSGLPVQHEGTEYIIRIEEQYYHYSKTIPDTDSPQKYHFGVKVEGSEHFTKDTASTREFTMTDSKSDAINSADDLLTHYINQKSPGDLEAVEQAKHDLLTCLTGVFPATNPMNNQQI